MSQAYIQKRSVESCFPTDSFHALFNKAKQHSNVNGVSKILSNAKTRLVDYDKQREQTVAEYQPRLDVLFTDYEQKKATSKTLKAWLIVAIVVMFLWTTFGTGTVSQSSILYVLISAVALIDSPAVIALIILKVIFSSKAKAIANEYESTYSEASGIGDSAARAQRTANVSDYHKIDSLYLGSLSLSERELVLMRREQQQQHEEMMRQQKQHQTEVESLNKQIQSDQHELLEYERDRQRRMGRL